MKEVSGTSNTTILIVDDDPTVLEVVTLHVSEYGFQTVKALDGKAALLIAQETPKIDLLLTDVMMPVMNGVDLAIQFKTLHPDAQVLFMSGYISPSIPDYRVSGSVYGFIQKPFEREVLFKKIKSLLERSSDPIPTTSEF